MYDSRDLSKSIGFYFKEKQRGNVCQIKLQVKLIKQKGLKFFKQNLILRRIFIQ